MTKPHLTHLHVQRAGLFLGPVAALFFVFFLKPDPSNLQIGYMAAIVTLMSIWWITEAIPLAATSLMPFVLYPLLRIMGPGEVANSYFNPIIFLFFGGFLIALAMERWNLHRRIALAIIGAIGSEPRSMVLGFMLASGFLSMWISNTATAVMMLPVGLAIILKVEEAFGAERSHGLSLSLMLGIAYGCSIGGVATLVGTPPNLVLARVYESSFPMDEAITFGQWILFGFPLCAILLVIVWLLLTRLLCRVDKSLTLDMQAIRDERNALGRMSREEKSVAIVFVLTAILWIFRNDIDLGFATLPGWSRLWEPFTGIHDGTIAVAMALLLFLIPAGGKGGKAGALLDDSVFAKVPWNIILLFGGGFALADGFKSSGLSSWIAESATQLEGIQPLFALVLVSGGINFLTELTSNTATTQMMLPLLASLSIGLGIHPKLLMVGATVSASMAFMMPVATPPNAIVFSSKRISISEMARIGLVINLVAILLVVVFTWLVLPHVFDLSTLPTEAVSSSSSPFTR
ncbi:MAG: SLC13 family permease [Kiritimatiellae bacterium]|jgi:sodium-dependent dicarboxylate transporter 2/3/5|nr:SLC13 family permease [Kiritimatiellia bacterium]